MAGKGKEMVYFSGGILFVSSFIYDFPFECLCVQISMDIAETLKFPFTQMLFATLMCKRESDRDIILDVQWKKQSL